MQPNGPVISPRRPALDFTSDHSRLVPDASLLVSCIRCRRLHATAQPLDFNPVCPACAGPIRSLEQ